MLMGIDPSLKEITWGVAAEGSFIDGRSNFSSLRLARIL
jgi:hypothetical protein